MSLLDLMPSPVILSGDDRTAYRDPAAIWRDGCLHLYFTLVENPTGEPPYLSVAECVTRDFRHWSEPRRLTRRDRSLNFSSPGCVLQTPDGYVMCVQTYCREHGEKYGNERCRLYLMRSTDLQNWSEPELLRVLGSDIPERDMGRMIDPYIIRHGGEWWCFYKQNGIRFSSSGDLRNWQPRGRVDAGENPCVLETADGYVMFHSPHNGIGVKRSDDLLHWTDVCEPITLGQRDWAWARGRETAAFVADLRGVPEIGRFVMFFHGSGPEDEETMFDTNASIGVAWSDDLARWQWRA